MLRHGICFAWHGASLGKKTISTCRGPAVWNQCSHGPVVRPRTVNRALRQSCWRRAWSPGNQTDSNGEKDTGGSADSRAQTPSPSLTVDSLGSPNQLLGAIHDLHPSAIPSELPPLPIAYVPASSADVLDGLQVTQHASLSLVPAQQQLYEYQNAVSGTIRTIQEDANVAAAADGAVAAASAASLNSISTPAAASKQSPAKLLPEHQHWLQVVCVCASAAMLCYLTRTNMSTAIVPMAEQFAWDRAACGNILSAFFAGYGMTQVIGGQLADRYGGSAVLAGGLALWSACAAAAPAAATIGIAAVVATRVGVGLAQGLAFPAMHALLARHVPPRRRSAAIGSIMGVAHCGTALAFGISPCIIQAAGWQASFTAFGGAALLWLPFWFLMSRNLAAAGVAAATSQQEQLSSNQQQHDQDKAASSAAAHRAGKNSREAQAGSMSLVGSREQHLADSLVAAAVAGEHFMPPTAAAAAVASPQHLHAQQLEAAMGLHSSFNGSSDGQADLSSCTLMATPAAGAAAVEVGLWPLMRRREVWAIAIAQYTSAWGFYGLLAWLPSFFLEHCGVALNSLGAYTLAPYLVMAVVGGSAGMLADSLIAKGWRVRDVRVAMQVSLEG